MNSEVRLLPDEGPYDAETDRRLNIVFQKLKTMPQSICPFRNCIVEGDSVSFGFKSSETLKGFIKNAVCLVVKR